MSFTKLFQALSPFFRPWLGAMALVGIILLGEIAFNAALPYSFKFIVDDAILKNDGQLLAVIISSLAVAAVAVSLLGLWRDNLYARITANVIADIRFRMFSRLQHQSLSFFGRNQAGDLLARFSGDLNSVEYALAASLAWAVIPLLDVVSHTTLLFTLNWQLALIALIVCPIIIVGPRLFTPRATAASTLRRNQEGEVLASIQENLAAQPTVKALTFQEPAEDQFQALNRILAATSRKVSFLGALVERSAGSGILLMQVTVTGIGAYMVFRGSMSLGELVSFQALFVTLSYSLMYVAQYVPTLIQAAGGMTRIREILDEPCQIEDAQDAGTLPPFAHEIGFSDVCFGYSDNVRNLDHVNLVIEKGQNVAFVGPSGSGKSTVVNLLMRFFDPQQGAVRYDGYDVRGVTQESLRANIAIVFQENFLFNISLRENIRIGRLNASDEDIADAARGAEIHDFIQTLPQGYDTLAGERGGRLSGGQRQRIGIARALLRNPPILILDEATSALDPTTEASINATLHRIAKNRTVISVTHRLGSVTGCDRIFVMDRGQVVESGSHAELLAKGGVYAGLATKQHGISISSDGDEASVTSAKLRSIPVLNDLPAELLDTLVAQFGVEQYSADRVIFQEGDVGDRFYLIARGSVEVFRPARGAVAAERIAVLQDGDYLGELALLTNAPRNASARTITHCLMLTLPRTHFKRLLEDAPELKAHLLERYRSE